MTAILQCDLLVIGAGAAGMLAGIRGAGAGLDTLVAGNPSCIAFSSGIIDCLGVYPAGSKSRVMYPEKELAVLVKNVPGHPYARAGYDKIRDYFKFTEKKLGRAGLSYVTHPGERAKNFNVLTSMGTLRPGFMIPETMSAGASALERSAENMTLLVAGIKGLAGFSAVQVAEAMSGRFDRVIPLEAKLPGITTGIPPQILAEKMEEPRVMERFIAQLSSHAAGADIIGMPAVCGLNDSTGAVKTIEDQLRRPLFEIPGPPPSVPGLRLKRALEKSLSRDGGRLLSNVRILEPVFDGKRFSLKAGIGPEPLIIRATGVILATGRFFGGGLHARRERIVEPVFHLDVAQPTGRHLWHDSRFLTPKGHAVNRAGIETDNFFRPLDERARPVYTHLYAAGSILAHNDWVRLKSGTGSAIVSACCAADAFAGAMGAGHGI